MSNIGKLTTFKRLIDKESVIMIPKVQRDYAYGRKNPKAEEIVRGLLDKMLNAISKNDVVLLDFVYGGPYVRRNKKNQGLIPLDGQQRLTTLFLLFFYVSLVDPNAPDDVSFLKKFRYETRQSATNFCSDLIDHIRPNLRSKTNKGKEHISSLIKNEAKYLPSYDGDPTIQSMLNVLDVIEEMWPSYNLTNAWNYLNERDNIQFYSISLDEFGLTDDLYIKMNSRGKKLTEFEIFKSDFLKAIKAIDDSLKDSVSQKMDNSWMDILWDYSQINHQDTLVFSADSGYMQLLRNIFRLELFLFGIETKKDREASLEEIITDKNSVNSVVSFMDSIYRIHKDVGINTYWNKYFYFSDDIVSADNNRIRLFWLQKHNRKSVFYLAMERNLSVPELVYFYAIYLAETEKLNEDLALKRFRIVRNLITANTRANTAHYSELPGFLADIKSIVKDGIIPDKSTFISTMCEEERNKNSFFSEDDYLSLLQFENHYYLQGSLGLFINKYYDKDNKDSSNLKSQLIKFENSFNNDTVKNFNLIRSNLIDQDYEYMQWESGFENNKSMIRRYFIHKTSDPLSFLIKNERLRNQDAILDIIAKGNLLKLKDPSEKCQEFDIHSWQYYMTKYPIESNNQWTKYGCYAWDDRENRPLEMVMLNSSYHSKGNIEWLVLNYILYQKLNDYDKYALDEHASSPMVIRQTGLSLSITQEGWKLECEKDEIINFLREKSYYNIKDSGIPEESVKKAYIIDQTTNSNMDYIELGIVITKDIQSVLPQESDEDTVL